jgi:hypothetical protein
MDPTAVLQEGCHILEPLLRAHGFQFEEGRSGASAGGHFASGAYVRANRRLELHFRHSLGLVRYRVGDRTLDHETYMWVKLGKKGGNRYPGFSDDPLDAFRHLCHDLDSYAVEFLSGEDEAFERVVAEAERNPVPKGFKALSRRDAV